MLYARALRYKMGYFNKWGRKVLFGRKKVAEYQRILKDDHEEVLKYRSPFYS